MKSEPILYRATRNEAGTTGCIDLVESPDDGGWYAQEYDFNRTDNATRTSRRIYHCKADLAAALRDGTHRWQKWS